MGRRKSLWKCKGGEKKCSFSLRLCSCSWDFVLQWLLLLQAPHCNWNKFQWGHNWQNTARTNVPRPLSILALRRENRMESAPAHSSRKCVWGEGCMYVYIRQDTACLMPCGKGRLREKGRESNIVHVLGFFFNAPVPLSWSGSGRRYTRWLAAWSWSVVLQRCGLSQPSAPGPSDREMTREETEREICES